VCAAAVPLTSSAGYVVLEQEVLHNRRSYIERREMPTGFLWGNLKERDYLEDLGIDGG
jgi:hypothetical protein